MENKEPIDMLESYQKRLEDYALQLEAINNKEDTTSEEMQSQMDYLMRMIDETTAELEELIPKL